MTELNGEDQTMDDYPAKISADLRNLLDTKFSEVPMLMAWPEDEFVLPCEQASVAAELLIQYFHKELVNARIAYVMRKSLSARGGTTWATAQRPGGLWRMLANFDFVVSINWTVWKELTYPQRAALLDHELEHCQRDDGGGWCLIPHDLEEFNIIVNRWGAWRASIENFQKASMQLDLEFATDE